MKKQKELKLYCFSPPVMLATFVIEIVAALYVTTRYRANTTQRLAVIILMLLAIFQLAEYNVCGRLGISSDVWSRLGYVAITMLPAFGLHLTYSLAKKSPGKLVIVGYTTAGLFASLFAFGGVFENHMCGGNYVIFQLRNPIGGMFFAYYYTLLFTAIFAALKFSKAKRISQHRRDALVSHVMGYALFMIPSSLAMILFPETAAALPSVMCGFAVLYALVLTFVVLPHAHKAKLLSYSLK